jgi:hypothetical protein
MRLLDRSARSSIEGRDDEHFDLETMEIKAERNGETAPWANPNAPDDVMPEFDANSRIPIGAI